MKKKAGTNASLALEPEMTAGRDVGLSIAMVISYSSIRPRRPNGLEDYKGGAR
jgi:hypothetical protein